MDVFNDLYFLSYTIILYIHVEKLQSLSPAYQSIAVARHGLDRRRWIKNKDAASNQHK